MEDYFSERFSALYIRGAVLSALVFGIFEILVALRAPDVFSKWAVVEGILVLALAFGVWKRNLPSAIALIGLKTAGAVVWSLQSGRPPTSATLIQLVFYGLAAGAIFFNRRSQPGGPPTVGSKASGGEAK